MQFGWYDIFNDDEVVVDYDHDDEEDYDEDEDDVCEDNDHNDDDDKTIPCKRNLDLSGCTNTPIIARQAFISIPILNT